MKKSIFKKIWAIVCTVEASTAGTLLVFAGEQAERQSKLMMSMDIIQTVSLILVITVAVVLLALYAAKMVLKQMHVAPEENEEQTTEQEKEE